ncbi:MAG: hypothetical protein DMG07_28525 [Acidobacteria bacterium]|nr:MAG: hypothetical protein DMG07_28525 [Acidobacteriota bacterium]
MPVAELVHHAAVLEKKPMIEVGQPEGISARHGDAGILLGQPRAAVGIVIDRNDVAVGDDRREHDQLNRQPVPVRSRGQSGLTAIPAGDRVGWDPQVDPERLGALPVDPIIGIGQAAPVRVRDRDEGVGVVAAVGLRQVEPLAKEVGLELARRVFERESDLVACRPRVFNDQVKRTVAAPRAPQYERARGVMALGSFAGGAAVGGHDPAEGIGTQELRERPQLGAACLREENGRHGRDEAISLHFHHFVTSST